MTHLWAWLFTLRRALWLSTCRAWARYQAARTRRYRRRLDLGSMSDEWHASYWQGERRRGHRVASFTPLSFPLNKARNEDARRNTAKLRRVR